MLKFIIVLFYFIFAVSGNGQFVVLQHPKNLEFSGDEAIDGRDIPTVFAASLGFTIRQGSDWSGLKIKSPFGLARAVVVVAVDGVSSLGNFDNLSTFPINPVHEESRLWRILQEDVIEHYPMQSNRTLLRVDLGTSTDLNDLSLKSLDNDEEESFIQDLAEMNSYIDSYKKNGVNNDDNNPIINWFTLSSLHLLSDVKGADNEVTIEAKEKVRESLIELGKVLSDATNGRALVAAIISDASHTRRVRAVYGGNDTHVPENRATEYSESYPAIFNIMLWFGVAFIFSLIAISYFIGTMDPGRDSIIYRMTSNRMKKDS